MAKQSESARIYWVIYFTLLFLLGATIALAFVDMGHHWNTFIAIGIGCMKAGLILLVFMHLHWRDWLTWFFAAAGFIWLAILLTLAAADYSTRNHPSHSSPKGEPTLLAPSE